MCEFGGFGCGESVHATLEARFSARGLTYQRPFYFPTIGQYAPLLEKQGLLVETALLFDRPTPQKPGHGIADWVNMFVTRPFEEVDGATKAAILAEMEVALRSRLCRDDIWYIDYVRIRLRARKMA